MNLYLCYIFGCAALTAASAALNESKPKNWGVATNNTQMSITLNSFTGYVRTNQPVRLIVRIRNISKSDTLHFDRGDWLDTTSEGGVRFDVTSPSGKNISPNPRGSLGGSGAHCTVAPGKTNEFEFDLRYVCKFTEVGAYEIVARKTVMLPTNKQWEVVSNPLLVHVAP